MRYKTVVTGVFHSRPNRFIALVDVGGREEVCHVKNTGRCRELLLPGAQVVLSVSDNPARKTKYDLVAVWKEGTGLVNMDSQAPNAAAAELLPRLFPGAVIRAEQRCGLSRFDFSLETEQGVGYLEVKGCTLEREGHAYFPDAPTERGVKHLRELTELRRQGRCAAVLFLVQMKGVHAFSPNDGTDPAFGAALREARGAGVEILCYDCLVTPESMIADQPVPVEL
ncbi:MAG: DNA/RNA nuclease SfsA [Oscillospiraceae bacterium]|nr:DNA/RNA nuclease SfsA [bacterium]MDY5100562.1 DNA/RNA nuclease SfsA [Oscillospiraceae bacterium]